MSPQTVDQTVSVFYLASSKKTGKQQEAYYLTRNGQKKSTGEAYFLNREEKWVNLGAYSICGLEGVISAQRVPGNYGVCKEVIIINKKIKTVKAVSLSGVWCSYYPNRWRYGIGLISQVQFARLGGNHNAVWADTKAEGISLWPGHETTIAIGDDGKLGYYVDYNTPNIPTEDRIYFKLLGKI